jgi:CheY-like chemotaxis protein
MKANLLVVEDHDDTRRALELILTRRGYKVACASSGAEAIRLATEFPIDLVVMDHGLPDGNGCRYMKLLHDFYNIPGIALTANAFASDLRLSRAAGCYAHFNKPVDASTLCSAIDACLRQQNGALTATD